MTWFQFFDMHSGGGRKLDWENIFIEADSRDAAEAYFSKRFGRDPNNVTCECCGEDYSISEYGSLAEATAYERKKNRWPLADYLESASVLVVTEKEP